jgi:Family of unknown function (DUF6071)
MKGSRIMLLFANGCSMTLGAELADPDHASFPALIARHFGLELVNAAHSGSSNCRILRTTLTWIADYLGNGGRADELFVLIGWTAPDRRELGLTDEEATVDANIFWRNIFLHCRLSGASADLVQLHELIIRSFWCDRESMARFLVAANAVQGVLKSHGIRYCFVHGMPVCPVHPEITALADAIDSSRFFQFMESQGDFLSVNHGQWHLPIGSMNHPLEEAHSRWSALLVDHIDRGHLL